MGAYYCLNFVYIILGMDYFSTLICAIKAMSTEKLARKIPFAIYFIDILKSKYATNLLLTPCLHDSSLG